MRQSQLFTKTSKTIPKEESKSAQLLIRGGFIDKLMAGVYSFLPLGFLVLKKIENIIREEMIKIGAQEVLLPALHPKEIWEKTDRWKYPEMFKLKDRREKEYSLGWTHEEIISFVLSKFVHSVKDLPVAVFQIQTKFRDELRSKGGLLRTKEFIMKDLYSFHETDEDLDRYYEIVKEAYFKIFERCQIKEKTFLCLASGGAFSEYSHEFQTETESGEDLIYLCENCKLGVNKEIIQKEKYQCPQCKRKISKTLKTIEVGNIFKLGDRFTKPFNLKIKNKEGKEKFIVEGCYGIGLPRLMAAIVEVHHDERGILWPKEVAPFLVHLIPIEMTEKKIINSAEKIYKNLLRKNFEVLYDDRKEKSVGERFYDADLIGIPYRVVVSKKTLQKECVGVKRRDSKQEKLIKIKDLIKFLKSGKI
jgi:prolyl-tRNA synthetase